MSLYSVFHPLWKASPRHQRRVFHFHRVFVLIFFCVSATVFSCDGNSVDKEEYLLKSHKVIEAVPRALNRADNEISTSLVADGLKMSADPCSDRKSYEAIRTLHRQLDDDASGDIDVDESDEFLRDELQYENGYERHREFHGDDKSISVDELWEVWKVSRVHNWTVDETVEWLLTSVELPQYEHNFRNNGVDGTCLPRMAINSNSLLSGKLGIKDPISRQKIALKAMDVVLFGPPRRHNYVKDAILAVSLIIATGGCWFAYVQHKYSQTHMQKMMRDMEVLQKAEDALLDIQQELNKAKQEQEIVNSEKLDLERRLKNEMKASSKVKTQQILLYSQSKLYSSCDQNRLRELEEQLRNAQSSLHDAESRLGARSWVAPPTLQHWLQLTHELELKNYNKKKAVAEQQLQAAKEGCEKLSKKRSTFMGAFRIAHGGSIDDVDDRIVQAKTALSEVTSDLQERMHRWKQIERLCGVPIIHNPGMTYLETLLKPPTMNGTIGSLNSGAGPLVRSNSEGTLVHEESPPPYAASGISSVALLPNIPPPPKYSKTSPSYSQKASAVSSQKNLHNSNQLLPSSRESQCADSMCHNIMEVAAEEEFNQLCDVDDELTERSMTPLSCSSQSGYSDVGKSLFIVNDRLNELGTESMSATELSVQEELDKKSTHSDQCSSNYSNFSANGEAGDIIRKTSTGVLEEKKKKKKAQVSSIVATIRSSLSSSNFAIHESTSSDTVPVDEKRKKDKNTFLSRLRHKKAKIM